MTRAIFFAFTLALVSSVGFAESNSMDDTFAVRKLDKSEATLSGKPKDLKPGDSLYFIRPPYEFKVKSVDKDFDEVVVALPGNHGLKEGNALLRHPTERIKKFIETEARLKAALAE